MIRATATPRASRPALPVLGALFVAIGMMMVAPVTASAHGHLKSSTPSTGAHLARVPAQLRLDFSEAPELAFTSVRLRTSSGREIPLGGLAYASDSRRSVVVAITGAMEAGTYVVTWQMAGDDGHPVRGRFDFVIAPGATGVGVPPAGDAPMSGGAAASPHDSMPAMHHDPVSIPEGNGFGAESLVYVMIRWVELVALLLLVGVVTFRYFVLRRLRADAELVVSAERRAAHVGFIAALALAATLVFRLLAQSYAMHGAADALSPTLIEQMMRRTTWGWSWMLQLLGVLLAWMGFRGAARASASQIPGTHTRAHWWRLAALGALACAYSPAFAGHAASTPQWRALAILADGLHVLAASSWLGTLAVLLVAGLSAARREMAERREALVRSLVNAYSSLALTSAGIALVTGVVAAWLHVGSIPNLWGTRYGITLLVKLAIIGVVAGTGFYNWRVVRPRLGTDEAASKLQRSARVEVAVAVLVLLVTAILVAVPTSMDASM